MSETGDREIVGRVRAGDVESFAELVERYQRRVLALGLRFFGSREDAEDYVQEVFLRAFRKLHTYRGGGRFYSWLMRIAYNTGCTILDRRPNFESLGTVQVADTGLSPHEELERSDARRAVVTAIARLPRRYADCIGLYFFFDLSYQEVSEVTGYPLNTVRSHIRRAKATLADQLDRQLDDGRMPADGGLR